MTTFTEELEIDYVYEQGRKPSLTDREDPGEPEQVTEMSIHLMGENITDIIHDEYPQIYDSFIERALQQGDS
jgi:hypothetical protein